MKIYVAADKNKGFQLDLFTGKEEDFTLEDALKLRESESLVLFH